MTNPTQTDPDPVAEKLKGFDIGEAYAIARLADPRCAIRHLDKLIGASDETIAGFNRSMEMNGISIRLPQNPGSFRIKKGHLPSLHAPGTTLHAMLFKAI